MCIFTTSSLRFGSAFSANENFSLPLRLALALCVGVLNFRLGANNAWLLFHLSLSEPLALGSPTIRRVSDGVAPPVPVAHLLLSLWVHLKRR